MRALFGEPADAVKRRILVVDDEAGIRSSLKQGLVQEGFAVETAADARQAMELSNEISFDIVILDVMLPGTTGTEVCRRLRSSRQDILILMLTARDSIADRVRGLDAGADDYLLKPFDFDELLARLRALLRRRHPEESDVFRCGPFVLDDLAVRVWRDDKPVELSPTEYALFRLLISRPGKVVTREEILNGIWETTMPADPNVVDVYIGYLRKKLDPDRQHIATVRGRGFRLDG